jgi:hypothetical protein
MSCALNLGFNIAAVFATDFVPLRRRLIPSSPQRTVDKLGCFFQLLRLIWNVPVTDAACKKLNVAAQLTFESKLIRVQRL